MRRIIGALVCIGVFAAAFAQPLQGLGARFDGFKVGSWIDGEAPFKKWLTTLGRAEKSTFRVGDSVYWVVISRGGSGLIVSEAAIIEAVRYTVTKEKVGYKCVSGLACSTETPLRARLSKDKKWIELFTSKRKEEVVLLRYATS